MSKAWYGVWLNADFRLVEFKENCNSKTISLTKIKNWKEYLNMEKEGGFGLDILNVMGRNFSGWDPEM